MSNLLTGCICNNTTHDWSNKYCPVNQAMQQNLSPSPTPASNEKDVEEVAFKFPREKSYHVPKWWDNTKELLAYLHEQFPATVGHIPLVEKLDKIRNDEAEELRLTRLDYETHIAELKAAIVKKDVWINKVPHASHCPRSHLSLHFTKGTICECGKDEALSPTITSDLSTH